jgi:hypothetical protein
MNNSDERDYAEERANTAEMQEEDHCIYPCGDVDAGGDCVCCPCCCQCLGCEYGPRDGMLLTAEQRVGVVEGFVVDVPPNAGSAS